jgi:hypothetical protein
VVATVAAGTGYVPGNVSSATVTIADNDTAPAPPPSTGGSSSSSGGGGGAVDPLTLIGALAFVVFAIGRRNGARQKVRR